MHQLDIQQSPTPEGHKILIFYIYCLGWTLQLLSLSSRTRCFAAFRLFITPGELILYRLHWQLVKIMATFLETISFTIEKKHSVGNNERCRLLSKKYAYVTEQWRTNFASSVKSYHFAGSRGYYVQVLFKHCGQTFLSFAQHFIFSSIQKAILLLSQPKEWVPNW